MAQKRLKKGKTNIALISILRASNELKPLSHTSLLKVDEVRSLVRVRATEGKKNYRFF